MAFYLIRTEGKLIEPNRYENNVECNYLIWAENEATAKRVFETNRKRIDPEFELDKILNVELLSTDSIMIVDESWFE